MQDNAYVDASYQVLFDKNAMSVVSTLLTNIFNEIIITYDF